jgi:Zn-finger nucleic acid-binding protein
MMSFVNDAEIISMNNDSQRTCPRCGSHKMEAWSDLADDEKLLAEKLPGSAEYSKEQRKKHRYCTQCWFETVDAVRRA